MYDDDDDYVDYDDDYVDYDDDYVDYDDDYVDYDDDCATYDDDELEPSYSKDPNGNIVSFNIEILNPGVACSTIVVFNNHTFSTDMATNVKRFKDLFTSWDRTGGRYKIEQHSFIFASTIHPNMASAVKFFEKMGFQSIGPEYNSKNDTEVIHWIMPIKEFVKKLSTVEKDFEEAQAKALREEEDSLQIVIDPKYRRLVEAVKNHKNDLDHFNYLLETFYQKDDTARSRTIAWRDKVQKDLEESQKRLDAHMAKRHKLWVSRKKKEEARAAKEKEAA